MKATWAIWSDASGRRMSVGGGREHRLTPPRPAIGGGRPALCRLPTARLDGRLQSRAAAAGPRVGGHFISEPVSASGMAAILPPRPPAPGSRHPAPGTRPGALGRSDPASPTRSLLWRQWRRRYLLAQSPWGRRSLPAKAGRVHGAVLLVCQVGMGVLSVSVWLLLCA